MPVPESARGPSVQTPFKIVEDEINKLKKEIKELKTWVGQIRAESFLAHDLLSELAGKTIEVELIDGKVIVGKFQRLDRYNVELGAEDGTVLVTKHVIRTIRLKA